MDNTAARTAQAVGTGAPVESGSPDVDAAAAQAQQPPRPPVDDDDNKYYGTNNTHNNTTVKESTMQERNTTKRSHPSPSSSLPDREKKRSNTMNKNNTIRSNKWELTPISVLLRTSRAQAKQV